MSSDLIIKLKPIYRFWRLPRAARMSLRDDRRGLSGRDPGARMVIAAGLDWIARAQDLSASRDGGVARDFSLISGWSDSYPETSGYIVPTLIDWGDSNQDQDMLERARRMLDWLVSIQFPEGGFPGGMITSIPQVPVTFNTGQILLGLAAGAKRFGQPYTTAMHRAALWLADTQDRDGCWRAFPTPFAAAGEKTYETHVSWGLLEAGEIASEQRFKDAAIQNVHWAMSHQQENGWLDRCCLNRPAQPLTHTLGYALRGLVEAYRHAGEPSILESACALADGLLGPLESNGYLPGRLHSDWSPAVSWACLTGISQIAICWLLLYQLTQRASYLNAALTANRYVRRSIAIAGPLDVQGAVKGSFPVDGEYGQFQFLNWACKFTIDANLLELKVKTT